MRFTSAGHREFCKYTKGIIIFFSHHKLELEPTTEPIRKITKEAKSHITISSIVFLVSRYLPERPRRYRA